MAALLAVAGTQEAGPVVAVNQTGQRLAHRGRLHLVEETHAIAVPVLIGPEGGEQRLRGRQFRPVLVSDPEPFRQQKRQVLLLREAGELRGVAAAGYDDPPPPPPPPPPPKAAAAHLL